MNRIFLGTIYGLAFGIIDVLIMIPLKYESRRKMIEAMICAFVDRFIIGFLIPNVDLGVGSVMTGLILGTILSLPSAIITRAYTPIIGIGALGGTLIGLILKFIA